MNFAAFDGATVNLDQVTHLTNSNGSLVFHLSSGQQVQVQVPQSWSAQRVAEYRKSPTPGDFSNG